MQCVNRQLLLELFELLELIMIISRRASRIVPERLASFRSQASWSTPETVVMAVQPFSLCCEKDDKLLKLSRG